MNSYPVIAWRNLLCQDPAPIVTPPATETDYPIDNVWDWREYTLWKPSASGDLEIKFDADPLPGDEMTVDTLAIAGHNLGGVGVTGLVLKYSDDDSTYYNCFTPIDPAADGVIFKRFAAQTHRYFKLLIPSGYSDTPMIGILFIGECLEVPAYPDSGFDPDRQEAVLAAEYSREGRLLGVAARFRRREISAEFKRLTSSFIDNDFTPFFEAHAFKPFFFSWDTDNRADETRLVRLASPRLEAPYEGAFRSLSLSMTGVAE